MIDFLFGSEDLPLFQDDLSGSCAAFHLAGLGPSFSSCGISRLGLSKFSNITFVNHHEARVAPLCLPSQSQRLCLRDYVSLCMLLCDAVCRLGVRVSNLSSFPMLCSKNQCLTSLMVAHAAIIMFSSFWNELWTGRPGRRQQMCGLVGNTGKY